MNTQTQNIFKYQLLADFADILKNNGFDIYLTVSKGTVEPKNASYFHFTKDDKIGYCEAPNYGGLRFSTVHKPCKECGTGYGLQDYLQSIDEPTVKDAEQALITAPSWAFAKDVAAIRKYKNFDEYISRNSWADYVKY